MEKQVRKRASNKEMIDRLKEQNAKYELKIAQNNEEIRKLEENAKPGELIEKIKQAGLTISDVMRMIDEKNKL